MAVTRQTQDNIDNDPDKVGHKWTVRNPHPDFDADNPDGNIINEFGHTRYPKEVDHPTKKRVDVTTTYIDKDKRVTNRIVCDGKDGRPDIPERVLVNSKEEEDALLAGEDFKKKPAKGWTK